MTEKEAEIQIKIWANEAVTIPKATLEKQQKYIRNRVEKNEELKKAIFEAAMQSFCFGLLYDARHRKKKIQDKECVKATKSQPNKSKISIKTKIQFRKRLKSILDEYDCGKKKIGDCTRTEITKEVFKCRQQGNGYFARANIFADVAKQMKDAGNKTVRQCVKPETFIKIVSKHKAVKMAI